jgi:hypothetical protein
MSGLGGKADLAIARVHFGNDPKLTFRCLYAVFRRRSDHPPAGGEEKGLWIGMILPKVPRVRRNRQTRFMFR